MDIGTDFFILAVVFESIRMYYYKEKSIQLLLMEAISGIFMMFAIYFLLVPFYTVVLTTTQITNVPACTSTSCTFVNETVNTTTTAQTRPNLFPQFWLGFFAAIIYQIIIIFWVIKDIMALFFVKPEDDIMKIT